MPHCCHQLPVIHDRKHQHGKTVTVSQAKRVWVIPRWDNQWLITRPTGPSVWLINDLGSSISGNKLPHQAPYKPLKVSPAVNGVKCGAAICVTPKAAISAHNSVVTWCVCPSTPFTLLHFSYYIYLTTFLNSFSAFFRIYTFFFVLQKIR